MGQPFLKSAVAVLEKSSKPLAAGEIVERAIKDGLLDCGATAASSATMRGVLTNNIRQKEAGSRFIAQNGKFKLRAGWDGPPGRPPGEAPKGHGIKAAGRPKKPPSQEQLNGAGAEHLVVSKLNMDGYGTVMPEPDEGVDVVATKNGRDYPLQVKTSKGRGGLYTFTFKKPSHERLKPGAHYVFVLRKPNDNVFVVVPYAEIQKQINLDNIPLKNGIYHVKMQLNTVSLGDQRADMSQYENIWPGAE